MDTGNKQAFIRIKAKTHRIRWSRHALGKIACDSVTVGEIEHALQQAELVEDYLPMRRFLPDCLVLVYVAPGKPMHCVIAINEKQDYILVVTVYHPNPEEWENDWRTRK